MVQWLDPKVLLGAALEVALSSLFARFADKREMQAGLPARFWDASGLAENGSLWLDYASDTGDGFDPTYAIAYLLARDAPWSGTGELKRGKVLVLGGDQVYPSADWEPYRNRFVGPYTAALPYVAPPEKPPFLFALPGNHDWYDGLTSFMRLPASEAGSAAGRPSRRAATSRSSCRSRGGCGRSTRSSTPTSMLRSSATSGRWRSSTSTREAR
jgi:hypothetical protein